MFAFPLLSDKTGPVAYNDSRVLSKRFEYIHTCTLLKSLNGSLFLEEHSVVGFYVELGFIDFLT